MAAVQPARRVRLSVGGAAVAGALAFTLLVAREPGHFAGGLVLVGGLATLALAAGIASAGTNAVAAGTCALGVELVIAFGRDPEVAAGAAFAGPALLLVAEAAFLAAELHPQARVPLRALAGRARRAAALAAAGLAAGVLCLAAGIVDAGGPSDGLEVVGVLAALGAGVMTAGPVLHRRRG